MRADVTIRAIRVPNPYHHGHRFQLRRGHPVRRRLQAPGLRRPDALDDALVKRRPGAIVRGGVYWDAYRDPVSNVVLLDKKTGYHLAQWNL